MIAQGIRKPFAFLIIWGKIALRHIVPISGKDSLATAIIVKDRLGIQDAEYIYNDVGADIPIVYDWLRRVEREREITISRIGADLQDIILDQGILPSFRARFCTRMAKIYPMEDYLGKDDCIVYFGIRADERRDGYRATKKNINPRYPLVEHGIDLQDVYRIIGDLAPPDFFWPKLYDATAQYVAKETLDQLPKHIKAQLFSWRTRMNCFFCFYQRQYEWVGLAEHYPDLFNRAVEMEETIGAADFTWNASKSLRTMLREKDMITDKRAKRIAKWIQGSKDTDEEGMSELINVVSCGLLCGK